MHRARPLANNLMRRTKGVPFSTHRFFFQRTGSTQPTSDTSNTTIKDMAMDMHAIGTHIFLSLATNGELRGETVPLRHISYELQPRSKRHRLPDWLVSGWWSNAPFLNFKEWVNNLWLREDAHPLGVACGI